MASGPYFLGLTQRAGKLTESWDRIINKCYCLFYTNTNWFCSFFLMGMQKSASTKQ